MTFVRGGGDMKKNIEEETNTPVDYYASLFPEELRDAVKAFDHKIRQAIIAALLMEDELSFTELRDLLKLSNSRIAPHLDMLVSSALIENVIREGRIERKYSFYRPSLYGQKFVKSLIDFIMLPESVVLLPPSQSPNSQRLEMQGISIKDIKRGVIPVSESRKLPPAPVKIEMSPEPVNLSKQTIKNYIVRS